MDLLTYATAVGPKCAEFVRMNFSRPYPLHDAVIPEILYWGCDNNKEGCIALVEQIVRDGIPVARMSLSNALRLPELFGFMMKHGVDIDLISRDVDWMRTVVDNEYCKEGVRVAVENGASDPGRRWLGVSVLAFPGFPENLARLVVEMTQ